MLSCFFSVAMFNVVKSVYVSELKYKIDEPASSTAPFKFDWQGATMMTRAWWR